MRTKPTRVATAAATAALLAALGGCGNGGDEGDQEEPPPSPTDSPTPTDSPGPTGDDGAARVQLRSAGPLGEILTDGRGRTLYLFEADKGEKSTCTDACAEAWPPLTTSGEPEAGRKARAGLLGTTERDDGSTQVTYNGHPLYHYEHDREPGDTKGQDVDGFGAEWYVLDASGDKVRDGDDNRDDDGDGDRDDGDEDDQDDGDDRDQNDDQDDRDQDGGDQDDDTDDGY